jgi:hypothetical protein
MLALLPSQINAMMVSVFQRLTIAERILILAAQPVLFSALMDLALLLVNAHLPMAALLPPHSDAPQVNVLTQLSETVPSLDALLMLQSSASTVYAPRATSSVSLPSPSKMPRPAQTKLTATSFLAPMVDVLALLTSVDLFFHAQWV